MCWILNVIFSQYSFIQIQIRRHLGRSLAIVKTRFWLVYYLSNPTFAVWTLEGSQRTHKNWPRTRLTEDLTLLSMDLLKCNFWAIITISFRTYYSDLQDDDWPRWITVTSNSKCYQSWRNSSWRTKSQEISTRQTVCMIFCIK